MYVPTVSRTFTSTNGEYILKTALPDKFKDTNPTIWKHTTCLIFKYDQKRLSYNLVSKSDVIGDPSNIFINNQGTRIVTIDQKGGYSKGQISAIYDTEGKLLKEWTLKEVFKVKSIFDDKRVTKFMSSSAGLRWRGRANWNYDNSSIRIDFPYIIDLDTMILTQDLYADSYIIDINKLEMRIKSKPKKANKSE